MTRLAGLELGGTNANVILGQGTEIEQCVRIDVTDARETLAKVAAQLGKWNDERPVDALGIASFGPVGVRPEGCDYGRILKTPKPGWAGADVLDTLSAAIEGPTAIHTDVTAAALAEGRWGAAKGCSDHIYITVGTGVGVGIIAGGEPVVGQLHPEAGHVRVRRTPNDRFSGSCPFHGDCLEGLASGSAIEARTGRKGADLSDDDPVWEFVIDALADASANLLLTLASQRIVFGGGVMNSRPWLVDAIAKRSAERLNGYLPFVTDRAPLFAAALGDNAGPRGALLLAEEALCGNR